MRERGYIVKNGAKIDITTSAGQKTGLIQNQTFAVTNKGAEVAYINTNNETASVDTSMPILIGEKVSGIRFPFGTMNHIGDGSTTLTINPIENSGF